MSQRKSKDTAVKSRFGSLSDVTKSGFISLMDRNILEDIAVARAANDAGDLRTDVFSDSSGIDGGLSSGQTVRTTPNFDVIATPGASLDLFRPGDITSGLQGNWKLDEASGNATDSSGNGNTLTDNNTVQASTDDYWNTSEGSRDFERANTEHFNITDASQTGLDLTGNFTIAFWIKPETPAGTQNVIHKGSTGYFIGLLSTGKLDFRVNGNEFFSTSSLSSGRWQHVVCIRDGTNKTIFIDGNLDAIEADTGAATDNVLDFAIGANNIGTDTYDGLLKDVGVWNTALTSIQIKSLALGLDLDSLGFRPDNSDLTAPTSYWKLNELSAGTGAISRLDSSGNGHTLTDNGTIESPRGGFIEGVAPDWTGLDDEYLGAADSADWDVSGGVFTVATWAKFDSLTNGFIFTHQTDTNNWMQFKVNPLGGQKMSFRIKATSDILLLVGTTSFVTDTWYHVAVTEDGDTWKLYVDGKDDNATFETGDGTQRTANYTATFDLGSANFSTVRTTGQLTLSDFAWWKGTALSAANIASLASGLPLQQEGIISYWKLDEESGTRVDAIGSNDLTDNNSVLFAAGQVSNAADFESSNSEFLSITDASQTGLEVTRNGYALMTWAKRESIGVNQFLMAKNSTGNANQQYTFRLGADNTAKFGPNAVEFDGASGIWNNTNFHHIVGQTTGSTKELWEDGRQTASQAHTAVPISSGGSAFTLGNQSVPVPGNFMDGLMDETIFSARYFREEEIKTVYNKGLNGKEATSSEVSVGGATATVISTEFSLSESPTHALIRVAKTLNTGSITFFVSRVSSPGSTLTDVTKWQEISEDTITDLTALDAGSSGRWAATITGDAELDDIAVVFGRLCI